VADPLPDPTVDAMVTGWSPVAGPEVPGGPEAPAEPPLGGGTPPGPRRHKRWLVVGAAATALVLVGGSALALRDDSDPTAAATPGTTTPGNSGTGTAPSGSVQEIVKKVSPAVVQLEPAQGVGSGVIFDKDGLILTAHHVVAGVEELDVKLADGTTLRGKVVGRMADRDLAVVAVDTDEDLPTAELAGEDTVEVGEAVVAIGSPFGISQTVTSGIVSGLDREIDSPVGKLTGLIQTDAPINPGNSGGPLIDADAKVIGINSAIASTSGTSAGVGFAVPVEVAKAMIDDVGANGGVDAPAVPDDSGTGTQGGQGLPPGLDDLLPPGFEDLLPPGFEDLLPGGEIPGGSGSSMELLQRLLDALLNGQDPFAPSEPSGQPEPSDPGSSEAEPALALIEVSGLPDGWSQERSSVSTSSGPDGLEGRQDVVLAGPAGKVAIVAERGGDARARYDALDGGATEVAGHEAKEIDGGGVAWMADDDLLVVLKADGGVAPEDIRQLADSIEVIR
jgi:putative serine protease PepD